MVLQHTNNAVKPQNANTHTYFCLSQTVISHTHGGDGVSQSRLPLLLPKCPEKPDSYLRVIATGMGFSRTWLALAATSFHRLRISLSAPSPPHHGPSPQAAVRTRCTPRLKHSSPSHSTDPSEAGSRQGVISPPPPFRLSSSMNNGPNTSELHPHLVQRHRLRENVGGVVLCPPPCTERTCIP